MYTETTLLTFKVLKGLSIEVIRYVFIENVVGDAFIGIVFSVYIETTCEELVV